MEDRPMTKGFLIGTNPRGRRTIVGTVDLPPGTRQEDPPPRGPLPEGTVDLDEQLRPDRLRVPDERLNALRRLSPRRHRWRELSELDRRVEELEGRRVSVGDELRGLYEQ